MMGTSLYLCAVAIFLLVFYFIARFRTSRGFKLLCDVPSSEAPWLIGHAIEFFRTPTDGLTYLEFWILELWAFASSTQRLVTEGTQRPLTIILGKPNIFYGFIGFNCTIHALNSNFISSVRAEVQCAANKFCSCSIFERPTSSKTILAIWTGPVVLVWLRKLADIESLLSDQHQLRKSINYTFLEPWLGQGLVNSDGMIWKSHRKIITHAFGFKILEGFLETITKKLDILTEILDKKLGSGYFDIVPFIANYTLDAITETAMSTNINAQKESPKFVESITSLTEIIIIRTITVWYFFRTIFNLTSYKNEQDRCISYINSYIQKILEKKNKDRKRVEKYSNCEELVNDIGEKKKLALLDLLSEIQSKNPQFTNKEIYDEVNTFMFAGYDTVSSSISFIIYSLSIYQDIQEKVYKEISEVLGDSKPNYQALMNLKYLIRVIKETMRLYPPVPYIGRQLNNDMVIDEKLVLPKGTNVAVFIYNHHRNPEVFPDPEKFDPDRFLPENIGERNPFAYIPFSAGLRNCIGQKYAMMEQLVTMSYLLRQYRIIAEPGFVMKPISHIVLRPNMDGVRIRLERR